MSQLSISGAVSGVDTASIINSLVSVQQNQQRQLQSQQAKYQKAADTFGSLISSLGDLGAQATAIATTANWQGTTASSSSTGVTATATGNLASSISFDVVSVARAHTVISSNTVASLGTSVASGPLTVTKGDGTTTTIATGSGSLAGVVAAINASGAGLSAAAVQTAPGAYRLQIAATSTGSASSFALTGLDGFAGLNVLAQGSDAQLSIGSDPQTAYAATSASNTFSTLVPGLSFTVSKVEPAVTVSSALDGSKVADGIQKLVDSANAALSAVATATQFNVSAHTGGPLVGDSSARSLQQGILNVASGSGAPGISLTRDGKLAFDRSAFVSAFQQDPASVQAKYGAGSSFAPAQGVTGTATLSSQTSATRAGSYAVHVAANATREQWGLDANTLAAGAVVTLGRGTQSVSYTVAGTDTVNDVINGLNNRSAAAGFGVSAQAGGAGALVTADATGSASAFTLSVDGHTQSQLGAGSDIQGSIDGVTATGVGNVLSLNSTASRANGLSIAVNASDADLAASAGDLGAITYRPGLAQKLAQFAQEQTQSGTGALASAQAGRASQVKTLQDQIDAWDRRLTAYRATLQTQFTAMETAIASLKSQAASLGFSTGSTSSSSSSSSSSSG
jgi:flagellar hook-associated protein 2